MHLIYLAILIAAGCRTLDEAAFPVRKASLEVPADANAVAGSYYRGDGTGYNVFLTLKQDGSYAAERHGCQGKYGDAAGSWRLDGSQITFAPSSETDMMKGHLKTLDVMWFEGEWIFLPTDKMSREFYERFGVRRPSCFQKIDRIRFGVGW